MSVSQQNIEFLDGMMLDGLVCGYPTHSSEQVRRLQWIRTMGQYWLGDVSHGTVLDLASHCGYASLSIKFEGRDRKIVDPSTIILVDTDQDALDWAQQNFTGIKTIKRDILQPIAELLPSIELGLCCEFLEHCSPKEGIQLIYRTMKYVTTLIITVPNAMGPRWDTVIAEEHSTFYTKECFERILNPDMQARKVMVDLCGSIVNCIDYIIEEIVDGNFLGVIITRKR